MKTAEYLKEKKLLKDHKGFYQLSPMYLRDILNDYTQTLQEQLKQSEFYRNQYGDQLAKVEAENEKLKAKSQPSVSESEIIPFIQDKNITAMLELIWMDIEKGGGWSSKERWLNHFKSKLSQPKESPQPDKTVEEIAGELYSEWCVNDSKGTIEQWDAIAYKAKELFANQPKADLSEEDIRVLKNSLEAIEDLWGLQYKEGPSEDAENLKTLISKLTKD